MFEKLKEKRKMNAYMRAVERFAKLEPDYIKKIQFPDSSLVDQVNLRLGTLRICRIGIARLKNMEREETPPESLKLKRKAWSEDFDKMESQLTSGNEDTVLLALMAFSSLAKRAEELFPEGGPIKTP